MVAVITATVATDPCRGGSESSDPLRNTKIFLPIDSGGAEIERQHGRGGGGGLSTIEVKPPTPLLRRPYTAVSDLEGHPETRARRRFDRLRPVSERREKVDERGGWTMGTTVMFARVGDASATTTLKRTFTRTMYRGLREAVHAP